MAATLTVNERVQIAGNKTLVFGDVALDNSYPTGGEAIDSSTDENFQYLLSAGGGTTATGLGLIFRWDATNQKLVVFWNGDATPAALPEVTNTTDLSARTAVPVIFLSY